MIINTEDPKLPKWTMESNFIQIISGHGFKLKEYREEGVPLIRINNVKYGNISYDDLRYLPEEYLSSYKEFVLEKGDILLALNRPITNGRLKIGKVNKSPAILYQRVGKLIAVDDRKYLMEFYYQYLQSERFINYLENLLVGSDQPYITNKEFHRIKFPVPPIKEQKKIASILSTWDKAIELNEKLIEQKKEQKKGLMQKLLTGEVRLPGFKGEWKKKKIGDCIFESREVAKEPALEKRLTVRLNLRGIEKREVNPNEKVGATTQYIRRSGQFIYGKQNLHKGALGLIPDEYDGFQTSSDIPSFDFKKGIYSKWFFYYISRESFYRNLERISTGTGSKRINPKDLYIVNIKVPEIREQKEIAKVVSCIDKEIDILLEKLKYIKKQKKGLMQLLLTGKVRVKV